MSEEAFHSTVSIKSVAKKNSSNSLVHEDCRTMLSTELLFTLAVKPVSTAPVEPFNLAIRYFAVVVGVPSVVTVILVKDPPITILSLESIAIVFTVLLTFATKLVSRVPLLFNLASRA